MADPKKPEAAVQKQAELMKAPEAPKPEATKSSEFELLKAAFAELQAKSERLEVENQRLEQSSRHMGEKLDEAVDIINRFAMAKPEPRPERKKASGTYVLTEKLYRAGRLYEAGERISITDEIPGKTWLPLAEAEAAEAAARAPVVLQKASDNVLG